MESRQYSICYSFQTLSMAMPSLTKAWRVGVRPGHLPVTVFQTDYGRRLERDPDSGSGGGGGGLVMGKL